MLSPEVLGQRIKYFRKCSKVSQLELEAAIDTSAGAVSRIEAGTVNPTKESILKIAKYLRLNNRELDYLIGITALPATQEEVDDANKEVEEYFKKKGVFAYLLDERWRFHSMSTSMRKVLSFNDEKLNQIIGMTTVRVIVDKSLPVIDILSANKYEELLRIHIPYYFGQVYFMQDDVHYLETYKRVLKMPFARDIWANLDADKFRNYNPQTDRNVWFNIKGVDVGMQFARESLLKFSRFEVVEYTPQNKFINLISKLI